MDEDIPSRGSSDIVATGFNPLKKVKKEDKSRRLDRYVAAVSPIKKK